MDAFRTRHPDEEGHYTWWSNRPGVREKNVGWRIDLTLASATLDAAIVDAFIQSDVRGSDHCGRSDDSRHRGERGDA